MEDHHVYEPFTWSLCRDRDEELINRGGDIKSL